MTHDPKKYRAMSVPYDSKEALEAAVRAFREELQALREKHRMREVLCTVSQAWQEGDDEIDSVVTLTFGDSNKHEAMAAYAFGFLAAEAKVSIERLMSEGKKRGAR